MFKIALKIRFNDMAEWCELIGADADHVLVKRGKTYSTVHYKDIMDELIYLDGQTP